MKKENASLLALLWVIVLMGCAKEEGPKSSFFDFVIEEASDVTRVAATITGSIYVVGNVGTFDSGFMYATSRAEVEKGTATKVKNINWHTGTTCEARLTGLKPNTTYHYCLYASNGTNSQQSDILSFKTGEDSAPTLGMVTVVEVGEYSLTLSSRIVDDGGYSITECGLSYDAPSGKVRVAAIGDYEQGEAFQVTIEGLQPATEYTISAYASNAEKGMGYGSSIQQMTGKLESPTVTTQDISAADLGATWVNVTGTVEKQGASAITERGFALSGGDIAEEKRIPAALTSDKLFTLKIDNLKPGTTYYVRAYAMNKAGEQTRIGYGKTKIEFSTLQLNVPAVGNISHYNPGPPYDSDSFVARVLNNGNGVITRKGFYWSTTNKVPSTTDNLVLYEGNSDEMDMGIYSVNPTPNTTYYIRAFAENEKGIGWSSNTVEFKFQPINPPSVYNVTYEVSGANSITVKSYIYIGDGTLKSKGFYYSLKPNYAEGIWVEGTTYNTEGSRDSFSAEITGLRANTTYYIWATAENEGGQGRGDILTIIPLKAPIVNNVSLSSKTGTTISVQAYMNESDAITQKGFCYTASAEVIPTIENSTVVVDNESTYNGLISKKITGLTLNTKYYIRAFATNAHGIGYSPKTFAVTTKRAPEGGDIESPDKN